jgi:hypothetical protein
MKREEVLSDEWEVVMHPRWVARPPLGVLAVPHSSLCAPSSHPASPLPPSSDAYAARFGVRNTNCQPANDASNYYFSGEAQAALDARYRHILSHVNPHFNKPWSQLSNAVFSYEAENEPQSYGSDRHNDNWLCDRSKAIRQVGLAPGILITSGGYGPNVDPYIWTTAQCPYIDVLAIHNYMVSGGRRTRALRAGRGGTRAREADRPPPYAQWAARARSSPRPALMRLRLLSSSICTPSSSFDLLRARTTSTAS